MSVRRRLRAAERRIVEPVVAETIAELEPLLAQMESILVDHLKVLADDLRPDALQMTMNDWGHSVWTGVEAGLAITTKSPPDGPSK